MECTVAGTVHEAGDASTLANLSARQYTCVKTSPHLSARKYTVSVRKYTLSARQYICQPMIPLVNSTLSHWPPRQHMGRQSVSTSAHWSAQNNHIPPLTQQQQHYLHTLHTFHNTHFTLNLSMVVPFLSIPDLVFKAGGAIV